MMMSKSHNIMPGKPGAYLPTLDEALRNLESNRRARAATCIVDTEVPKVPEMLLPVCSDAYRSVPNGFLRSALFAVAKGRRRFIDGEQLAAIDGIEIRYTGQRLDQGDLDVWESVLHAVRVQEIGGRCRVTSYALLKLMGKTDTGKNRATLNKRITRLVASALTIKQGRYTYIGGLIRFAAKDEKTQQWVIELDEKLRPLFAADQFTHVEWAVRHKLDGKPLAQWLHGFYASHAAPFPMRKETLLRLAGAENENPRSANQKLRKALDEVVLACNGTFKYSICAELVKVTKRVSGAQKKHLEKIGKDKF